MTVSEQIKNSTEEIKNLLEELILKHSKIYQQPDDFIFNFSGNHGWRELSQEGKQLQSRIKEKYSIYYAIIKSLLKNQIQSAINSLEESNKTIIASIEQNKNTWDRNTQNVFEKISLALSTMFQLVDNLYSHNNKYLLVPDTNALLSNPNIEAWNFDEFFIFTIILTPTILTELDNHKINHRNEEVRKKSTKIINKIKEYRRRGKLNEGVPIISNKIFLQTLAIEPNMKESLPWFEENNNDDRFLASILEVMRQNTKSNVYLITSDINLQNKAEYSLIPFVEPP